MSSNISEKYLEELVALSDDVADHVTDDTQGNSPAAISAGERLRECISLETLAASAAKLASAKTLFNACSRSAARVRSFCTLTARPKPW